MRSWIRRFTNEAILRHELGKYHAMFKLDDGKCYEVIVTAYSHKEARKMILANLEGYAFREVQPSPVEEFFMEQSGYLSITKIGE